MDSRQPTSTIFPTRRSSDLAAKTNQRTHRAAQSPLQRKPGAEGNRGAVEGGKKRALRRAAGPWRPHQRTLRRSEEHTSELQSQSNIVCRLLLEKKKHCPGHT